MTKGKVKALEVLHEAVYKRRKMVRLPAVTTRFGDDKDRVLRKKDGSYTYLVPDIANALDKLDRL